MADIDLEWRGDFDSIDVEALHAEGFGHELTKYDWSAQVQQHSLGWVVARRAGELVGFLNVAWDGGSHAFVLDPVVAPRVGRQGLGGSMVELARREAAAAGCEWLHVDFDDHLRPFYVDACGFTSTNGGVLRLNERTAAT
jgi:predicted N-acetyltransferase YhbS